MNKREKAQQVSLKGLLCRNGKILVLKTTNGSKYELPGGTMEFGEKPEEAFRREIKEELGFENVKMGRFLNAWSFIYEAGEVDYHAIKLDFEFFTSEEEIRLSHEHTEYKWLEPDEVEGLDMRQGHKDSIRKCFEGGK